MKKFVGREKEQKYLNSTLKSNKSEFIIMYGRRRLGKTTLLKQTLKDKEGIYFLSSLEDSKKNLEELKQLFAQKFNNKLYLTQDDSFSSYIHSIHTLLPKNFTIIIDEFPFLIKNDKSITSQFQKLYDEYLKDNNINLILCGSSISVMTDIQSYSSPLYGRRSGSIYLKEFSLKDSKSYFNKIKSLEDITKYHLLFGGIPYYYEQIDQELSFKKNIEKMFFESIFFIDEPIFLLKEEFRETKNYFSILKSIARGKTKFGEIADDSLIDRGTLSTYLTNLERLSIVEIERSFFDKENSKKTIYQIKDNFLYIYFTILNKYKSTLDNPQIQQQIIKELLPKSLGYLFEKEVRRILSKHYEKIGIYFNKEIEIDIIGKKGDTIDVIECKFQKKINENTILSKLNEKVKLLPKEFKYNTKIVSIDSGINLDKLYGLV